MRVQSGAAGPWLPRVRPQRRRRCCRHRNRHLPRHLLPVSVSQAAPGTCSHGGRWEGSQVPAVPWLATWERLPGQRRRCRRLDLTAAGAQSPSAAAGQTGTSSGPADPQEGAAAAVVTRAAGASLWPLPAPWPGARDRRCRPLPRPPRPHAQRQWGRRPQPRTSGGRAAEPPPALVAAQRGKHQPARPRPSCPPCPRCPCRRCHERCRRCLRHCLHCPCQAPRPPPPPPPKPPPNQQFPLSSFLHRAPCLQAAPPHCAARGCGGSPRCRHRHR